MRAPGFWWRKNSLASKLLAPISSIYSAVSGRPFGKGIASQFPVLCIGNFTAGGAGKTPVALALAAQFQARGDEVVFLSRGYGGVLLGPHLVSSTKDLSSDVGDEPLLLAKHAPTVIARDRVSGIRFIEEQLKPDLILMDDGFQSARIKPDHVLLVVDSERGLGNGKVIPAGPLRAPLPVQLNHSDSLLVVQGLGQVHETVAALVQHFERKKAPVYKAKLKACEDYGLAQKRVIAFSGIGNPQKFFDTVEGLGADLVSTQPFPDHHMFTEADAAGILEQAALFDAQIVTTAKDTIRLMGHGGNLAKLSEVSTMVEVELVFNEGPNLSELIEKR